MFLILSSKYLISTEFKSIESKRKRFFHIYVIKCMSSEFLEFSSIFYRFRRCSTDGADIDLFGSGTFVSAWACTCRAVLASFRAAVDRVRPTPNSSDVSSPRGSS